MDDSQILELYWSRDPDAIARSEEKYGGYCRSVALRILRSSQDAEECVNDTWLRAWNAIPPHRPDRLQAFLGKLTRNLSLDRWDRMQAQKRGGGRTALLLSELEDCIPAADNVAQAMDDAAIAQAISAWLWKQPRRSRVAFVRRYWYAQSTSQVAKSLGMTESGLKSLLHRLRCSLREHLEQEGIWI